MSETQTKSVGRVSWRPLIPGIMSQLVPMLLVGILLTAARWTGLYFIFLTTLVCAATVATLSSFLASWTGWRAPKMASAVGFVLGCCAYLSQFYVDFVYLFGLPAVWRFDLLPGFIQFSVANQFIQDEGVNVSRNWVLCIAEMLATGIAFGIAHYLAVDHNQKVDQSSCSECGEQFKAKAAILPPDFASDLAICLAEDRLEELPEDTSLGEVEGDEWSTAEIVYCFHRHLGIEPTFHLTLRETRFENGKGYVLVVLEGLKISPDDMVLIGEKCPGWRFPREVSR